MTHNPTYMAPPKKARTNICNIFNTTFGCMRVHGMKNSLLAIFIFAPLIVVKALASPLDPAENKFIRSLSGKNMEVLVSAEREISKLPKNDKELVLFTASAYLNQKFANLDATPTASDLDYRQRAYVMAVAVGRLQLLSHITGFQTSAECYSVEAAGLLAISRGEIPSPSHCRLQLYGPEIQGRHASETRSPKDSPLAEISNRWATSAMLNGLYSGELDNYGEKLPEYLSQQNSVRHCENEFKAVSSLQMSHYEILYLEAQNRILTWFVEFNERKDISPWEEKWSYITWSKSAILLGQNASRSPRVKSVLLGFGENAAAFLRKEKNFDQYMASNGPLAFSSDKIRQSIISKDPEIVAKVQKEVKYLSDCVKARAAAAARNELVNK